MNSIGKEKFGEYYKKNIKKFIVTDVIAQIKDEAFKEDNDLECISLPDALTFIGKCAFKDCKNLEAIEIPDNVKKIEDEAFSGCEKLSLISLPENVELGKDVFKDCKVIPVYRKVFFLIFFSTSIVFLFYCLSIFLSLILCIV